MLEHFYRNLPLIKEFHTIIKETRTAIKEIRSTLRSLQALNHQQQTANVHAHNTLLTLCHLAEDHLVSTHPRFRDEKRLLRHAFKVCSQNGEDGILLEIFRRIGTTSRKFVEIGAGCGIENNTSFLLSQGWTGLWIDMENKPMEALKASGQEDLLLSGELEILQSEVTRENVLTLLEPRVAGLEIDLFSLDIDQNTYHVWSMLREFKPRVAVIEYNAAIPPSVDWKCRYDPGKVWKEGINYGAGLKSFERLGRDFGYCLVGCDPHGVNAFFVRQDLVRDLFAEPFTSENHYEPLRLSMINNRGHAPAMLDRCTTDLSR